MYHGPVHFHHFPCFTLVEGPSSSQAQAGLREAWRGRRRGGWDIGTSHQPGLDKIHIGNIYSDDENLIAQLQIWRNHKIAAHGET